MTDNKRSLIHRQLNFILNKQIAKSITDIDNYIAYNFRIYQPLKVQSMDSIREIFTQEKLYLNKQHSSLIQSLQIIIENLNQHYQQAYKLIEESLFYVNKSFIQQLTQSISQIFNLISKMKTTNSSSYSSTQFTQNSTSYPNHNPYLIAITLKNTAPIDFTSHFDFSSFINTNKHSSLLTLTKNMLVSNHLQKMALYCTQVTSIQLKSHSFHEQFMIKDIDLQTIYVFPKLRSLSLCGSAVSDKAIIDSLKIFNQLKQLDLSYCTLLTDMTVKKLSNEQIVNIKLNALNSISQQAVLFLILQSYNLNYLQIKNCRQIDNKRFYQKVTKIYSSNQANFKWLQITSNIGVDLHINKLSYLTHLTTTETINDKELAVLLGQNKSYLNGILFTCCEELNDESLSLISVKVRDLKRLKLSKFTKLNDTLLKSLLVKFPTIEYLNLEDCYSLTNNTMKYLSEFSQNLKTLNISWCRGITDQGIKMFCKQDNIVLESINLSNLKYISNKAVKYLAKCCSSLKSLILQKCDQITDQAINQISQRIPQLQELVVNYCENLTDGSLSFVATRLRNLKRLEIEWCQASQKCIGLIAENLKLLQVLNLNFCPSVCDKEVKLIASNNSFKIQILKLQSCDKMTEQAFLCLSQSLRRVKHLNLRQCSRVTDSVVRAICVNSLSHLEHIDLSWCSLITDNALFSLSQYQHQLLFLNVSGCMEITDIGVEWISTTLKNLEYLNLSLCQQLTDKSVGMISQLRKLRRLFLCDLKRVTDMSISNLSELTGLQELQLSGCSQLSNSSLLAILHNLEKLSSLNINECKNIKSEFLGIMLDKVKSLRRLQISALEIDDYFLGELSKNLKKLSYINVSLCGKITDQPLIILVQEIPSLIKIDFQNTSISLKTKQKIVQILNSRKLYNATLS